MIGGREQATQEFLTFLMQQTLTSMTPEYTKNNNNKQTFPLMIFMFIPHRMSKQFRNESHKSIIIIIILLFRL